MAAYNDTTENQESKGGRVRWPPYSQQERSILEGKFLGDWESLEFLGTFWNPIYDQRDLFQYRQTVAVWRMRLLGKTFKDIAKELQIDERKACALVSGKNLHPHLVQMYLNSQMLKSRSGWRWVLDCTPKPTNTFPRAVEVPERIRSYQDILDFLKQFPPVPADHRAIRFFGLSSQWVEQHKPELFGFLLGFLVGDAGKYFPEYIKHARHYSKIGLRTNMSAKDSNTRILTYVQLCLSVFDLWSHEISPIPGATRWTSEASNIITWIFRVCLGLGPGQRTSHERVKMDWLVYCPRNFIVAFFQGLADSDGSVNKHGFYAEIGSIPNSEFYHLLLSRIGISSRVHPKLRPIQLRLNLRPAIQLPLFNPIIASYRFHELISHAIRRKFLPSPSFFYEERNLESRVKVADGF
jgi:hypothetical protein